MKSYYQAFGSTSPEAAVSLNFCSFLMPVYVFLITAVLPGHQSQSVDILFLIISRASTADMEENLFSSKSRRKNGNYS